MSEVAGTFVICNICAQLTARELQTVQSHATAWLSLSLKQCTMGSVLCRGEEHLGSCSVAELPALSLSHLYSRELSSLVRLPLFTYKPL